VLGELVAGPFLEPSEYNPRSLTAFLKHIQNRTRLYRKERDGIFCVVTNACCSNEEYSDVVKSEELIVTGFN
jgi:hypothetical protein